MNNKETIDELNGAKGNIAIVSVLSVVVIFYIFWSQMERYYPDWAYDAFIIPWFFSFIIGTYRYSKKGRGSLLATRTIIPIIVLGLPLLSGIALEQIKPIFRDCSQGCIVSSAPPEMVGYEPYCIYAAIISIFLVWLIPENNKQTKSPS